MTHDYQDIVDPIKLQRRVWPKLVFYDKQWDIIYSVWDNDETVVPAGNMLGKDFVAAFINIAYFLTRRPCRCVTTSVDGTQLEGVLWGEMRRFIQTAHEPISSDRGGPLLVNHLNIRKVDTVTKEVCGLSYLMGRVAAKGEGMLGHHIPHTGDGIPRTLFTADEASGVDDESEDKASTWADRKLFIGNPYPCNNFFKRAVEGGPRPDGTMEVGGDVPRINRPGYARRVIRIRAEDSPNVQVALQLKSEGIDPALAGVSLEGVLPWEKYEFRRAKWDKVRQAVSLDAQFWKGSDELMFPPQNLNASEQEAEYLEATYGPLAPSNVGRRTVGGVRALGCDPAEGGDSTAFTCGDELGVLELFTTKTPDTTDVVKYALFMMRKWDIPAENVVFDRGGGGKQHADRMRMMGYNVRTVAFGETCAPPPRPGSPGYDKRVHDSEARSTYTRRRAQLYGRLSVRLAPSYSGRPVPAVGSTRGGDPLPRHVLGEVAKLAGNKNIPSNYLDCDEATIVTETGVEVKAKLDLTLAGRPYAVPARFAQYRAQLAVIPRLLDNEGRIDIPPKSRKTGERRGSGTAKTLIELIGHSPDEADSLVLMLDGLSYATEEVVSAGGFY